ncbi:hypothetical protein [Desulfurobacterium sp.]
MVGFLRELADFITEKTELPVEIEPSPASPPDAHVRIIPKGLSYQSYGNTPNDLAKQGLVQLAVELHLVAEGTGEVFLKMVYEASLKLNRLFESYHTITLGTENFVGFSVAIDKLSNGEFFVSQEEGKFPYKFVEKWKGTLTWRISSALE